MTAAVGIVEEPLPRLGPGARLAWVPAVFLSRRNPIRAPLRTYLRLKATALIHRRSTDNRIMIGSGFRSERLKISIGGIGNRIEIGDDVTFSGEIEVLGFNVTVRIGDRSDIKSSKIVAWERSVLIGSDCLFATGTEIRSTDIHTIADRSTGERLNAPADVTIGDRVWVAAQVTILKGSRIPDGCIVGTRSLVTAAFDEPSAIIAGNPAGVVRSGVSWKR